MSVELRVCGWQGQDADDDDDRAIGYYGGEALEEVSDPTKTQATQTRYPRRLPSKPNLPFHRKDLPLRQKKFIHSIPRRNQEGVRGNEEEERVRKNKKEKEKSKKESVRVRG